MTRFNILGGNKNKKIKAIFFKFLILAFLLNNSAYAYFDPGTGAFIIQAIIALIAVITLYLGYSIKKLKKIFGKIKKILFKVDNNGKEKK
jgi:amino acid permease